MGRSRKPSGGGLEGWQVPCIYTLGKGDPGNIDQEFDNRISCSRMGVLSFLVRPFFFFFLSTRSRRYDNGAMAKREIVTLRDGVGRQGRRKRLGLAVLGLKSFKSRIMYSTFPKLVVDGVTRFYSCLDTQLFSK